jgi:hypothetical protein
MFKLGDNGGSKYKSYANQQLEMHEGSCVEALKTHFERFCCNTRAGVQAYSRAIGFEKQPHPLKTDSSRSPTVDVHAALLEAQAYSRAIGFEKQPHAV